MQLNSFSISSASNDIIQFFKKKDEKIGSKKFIDILFFTLWYTKTITF